MEKDEHPDPPDPDEAERRVEEHLLPNWLLLPEDADHPIRPNLPVFRGLTYDEIHAFILGGIGFPIGLGFFGGFPELAFGATLLLLGYALGYKELPTRNGPPKALATLAHEPWYFTSAYVCWFSLSLPVVLLIPLFEVADHAPISVVFALV